MKDKKKYTPFYEAFLSLCELAGLSATAAAKAAGISSGAPTAWKNKGAIPKPEQRKKLCTLFGVTDDELLGYAQKETPPDPKAEGRTLDISGLTEENQRKARDYFELLLNSQHNE